MRGRDPANVAVRISRCADSRREGSSPAYSVSNLLKAPKRGFPLSDGTDVDDMICGLRRYIPIENV